MTVILMSTETGSFTDQVSFEANVPNQKRTVKIPVSDDNIALESNLEFGYQLLGISDIRVQLGSISTTTLIITDDDSELTNLSYVPRNSWIATNYSTVVIKAHVGLRSEVV